MKRFGELIRNMPVNEHAFVINKSVWEKYMRGTGIVSVVLNNIFLDKEFIQISRGDLFAHDKTNIIDYIIKVILWGYPRGMRGNNFQKISENINLVEESLVKAKSGVSNWISHYEFVRSIGGLGLSTYTKLLYFLGINLNESNCLILDNRIIEVMKTQVFKEFYEFNNINYENAYRYYLNYLQFMNKKAEELEVDSGKLEMFLYTFGQNLKLW